jgi:hypothetical protein
MTVRKITGSRHNTPGSTFQVAGKTRLRSWIVEVLDVVAAHPFRVGDTGPTGKRRDRNADGDYEQKQLPKR